MGTYARLGIRVPQTYARRQTRKSVGQRKQKKKKKDERTEKATERMKKKKSKTNDDR